LLALRRSSVFPETFHSIIKAYHQIGGVNHYLSFGLPKKMIKNAAKYK